MSEDYLLLKWGSLKGWNVENNPEAFEHLKKWSECGVSMSAMCQKDTDEQKKHLCNAIDCFNGIIQNDWDGEEYTKEQAKKYIMEYGKNA